MSALQYETRIADILSQACAEHRVANILFWSRPPEKGYSEFVKLGSDRLIMAAVRPSTLNTRVVQGEAIVVSFEVKGALYWFSTRIVASVALAGKEYGLRLPTKIARIQLRACFRVSPSLALPAKIRALTGCRTPDAVIVQDISQKGIALSFPDNPDGFFRKGSIAFVLDLGKFGVVKLAAAKRSARHVASDRYVVGLEFHQPDAATDGVLSEYLSARQREELKKRTG